MKAENGVANIAEELKAKLRKIAQSSSVEDSKEAIDEFLSWKNCRGKLRNWFTSKDLIVFSIIQDVKFYIKVFGK